MDRKVAGGEGNEAIGTGEAAAAEERAIVARELGVVLRRTVSRPLHTYGVSPRLGPPPDRRGRPVVEVEPEAGRLCGRKKQRDGDGNEIGVSHEQACRGGTVAWLKTSYGLMVYQRFGGWRDDEMAAKSKSPLLVC